MKIAVTVLGAAVAGSLALIPLQDEGPGRDTGQGVALTDAKEALPSDTASDWVSYGDHSAVVRVAAEHEAAATDEEAAAGEGYLPRTVDLKVTERVWARSGAPALPDMLAVAADGWELKDGSKTPVGSQNASRLEIGHDYVIAFARLSDGAWAPLGSGGVLPYDNRRIGEGEYEGEAITVDAYRSVFEQRMVPGDEAPVAFATAGHTVASVRGLLRETDPDPVAARHFDLDAIARYEKVTGASEPSDTFCSVASPLAADEDSRYSSDELADVLTDLAAMTGKDAASLRAYAEALRTGTSASSGPVGTARKTSVAVIERKCDIDVGDLSPTGQGQS